MKLKHVCEVCGKEEILTPDEAFDQGWDYPPRMGTFGIISPRTCCNCAMIDTVWWKLTCLGMKVSDLSEHGCHLRQDCLRERGWRRWRLSIGWSVISWALEVVDTEVIVLL